ncbi:MAG: hypothetical protein WB989_29885 [Mycobacterium sp.]
MMHDHHGDCDVTGDPVLDQFGYQSPRRDFSQPVEKRDWLAQAKRDRAHRQARRQQRNAK